MCRVFVSCSYRDRAVGERVRGIVRTLGHEPLDDLDEVRGPAQWDEVVDRIEASDLFVALVSPAYADAQVCRLEARHAAAAGLPVLRLDLDARDLEGCHPAVVGADPVSFDPDDPQAAWLVAESLLPAPAPAPAPAPHPEPQPQPRLRPAGNRGERRWFDWAEPAVMTVLLAVALALLFVWSPLGDPASDPASDPDAARDATGSPAPGSGLEDELLSRIDAAGSARLAAATCSAGDGRVTCRNPAPNIRTVVLTPYPTRHALYDAYAGTVQHLSGGASPANVGGCTQELSEGEVSWNLAGQHSREYAVVEQELGGLDPVHQAAGRVFCTESSDVMRLVWTQDPGLVLATATGQPASMALAWWEEVHLALACTSSATGCDA